MFQKLLLVKVAPVFVHYRLYVFSSSSVIFFSRSRKCMYLPINYYRCHLCAAFNLKC